MVPRVGAGKRLSTCMETATSSLALMPVSQARTPGTKTWRGEELLPDSFDRNRQWFEMKERWIFFLFDKAFLYAVLVEIEDIGAKGLSRRRESLNNGQVGSSEIIKERIFYQKM